MILRFKIDPRAVKVTKKVLGALWWVVLVLLAALMFNIISAKMQGKVPRVFGHSVVNIITGSMEDTIPEGSYVLLKTVSPEEVKKGDIICFYSSDPAISGIPNTHRVVEEPIVTETGIEFVTKGDANAASDKYTAKGDNLIGRYVTTLDLLGRFASALDRGGMTVIILVLEALILGMAVLNFLEARRRALAEAEGDKNKTEPTLSKEEIEKMLCENPELVKEIEAKLGLSTATTESNNNKEE